MLSTMLICFLATLVAAKHLGEVWNGLAKIAGRLYDGAVWAAKWIWAHSCVELALIAALVMKFCF